MRLIDADALIENKFKNDISYNAFVSLVKRQPSAQPERIRGRWEHRSRKIAPHNTIWWYACSVCGGGGSITDFCPNCGADMREDQ